MKKGSLYIFPLLYVLLGTFIFMSPSSMLFAQDDAVEEIFWGDDDEGDLDEEFDFSEDDEEFSDDEESLEGFDFDDEFGDDDFDEDEFDDEGLDDFAEDFAEPEENVAEAASRLGYTVNLSGSSPGFVNNTLHTYDSNIDARVSVEMPILLQIAGIRFRLGAEVGTFNFKNKLPRGGEYKGIHATGILSFPAGPGQVKLGAGLVGGGMGVVAENTYGMSIGSALDLRFGIRSTNSFGVKNSEKDELGTVSWMDGIIALGFNL